MPLVRLQAYWVAQVFSAWQVCWVWMPPLVPLLLPSVESEGAGFGRREIF
jgi:hypothetical protein